MIAANANVPCYHPAMPTEPEVRDNLERGLPVLFPDITPNEPPADYQARTIRAAVLLDRVSPFSGIVEKPIVVHNARIEGNLLFAFVDFRCDFRLINCTVSGSMDLSFSKFARAAAFNNCIFEGDVTFRGCEAVGDLDWTGAHFLRLDARHLKVCRDLLATDVAFQGPAKMDQILVSGIAYFQGSHFHGITSFDLAKCDAGFDFGGEEYRGGAAKTVFYAEARFIGAVVRGYVSFISVEFHDLVWFDGITIDGDAHFEAAKFDPNRQLTATEFISFYGIHVAGQTVFDGADFGAYVRFDQARLDADTTFCSAHFLKRGRFDNVVFGGPVRFNRREDKDRPVVFTESADFVGAAAPDIHFEGTQFLGAVNFRDAYFKTVRFQDAENPAGVCTFPPFKTWWSKIWDRRPCPRIDLRGFTYDRILISREDLKIFKCIEPFDVQPYRQAEKVFRGMGDPRTSDRIYLMQRWRTLRHHLSEPRYFLRALGELIYWGLGNFGVRPYRLGLYALLLITLSTWQFTRPGAVSPKKDTTCKAHTLNRDEALSVSIAYFLPVEVPTGACWEATRNEAVQVGGAEITFLLWATLLRLAGWIVVPLGVAALGGLLRRDARN